MSSPPDPGAVPWWDGLMSPEEAAELEEQGRTRIAVAEYLARPKARPHQLADHAWHPVTLVCQRCGLTHDDWHAVPYGKGLACGEN